MRRLPRIAGHGDSRFVHEEAGLRCAASQLWRLVTLRLFAMSSMPAAIGLDVTPGEERRPVRPNVAGNTLVGFGVAADGCDLGLQEVNLQGDRVFPGDSLEESPGQHSA